MIQKGPLPHLMQPIPGGAKIRSPPLPNLLLTTTMAATTRPRQHPVGRARTRGGKSTSIGWLSIARSMAIAASHIATLKILSLGSGVRIVLSRLLPGWDSRSHLSCFMLVLRSCTVSSQRTIRNGWIYTTDDATPLLRDRARRLEEIGFKWSTKDPRHVSWQTRFTQLVEFVVCSRTLVLSGRHSRSFIADACLTQS